MVISAGRGSISKRGSVGKIGTISLSRFDGTGSEMLENKKAVLERGTRDEGW
jgi:hypothetical protein